MNQTTRTPLGALSSSYLIKDSKHAGICLNPSEFTLELYPTGYTKVSPRDKVNRQNTLQTLYESAVPKGREDQLYPFDTIHHNIKLVRDFDNQADKYAMHVILECPFSQLLPLNGKDLGWVPMRISKVLYKNSLMISGGRILKVRSSWHKKYYTVKVILGYNDVFKTHSNSGDSVRFIDIMSEI